MQKVSNCQFDAVLLKKRLKVLAMNKMDSETENFNVSAMVRKMYDEKLLNYQSQNKDSRKLEIQNTSQTVRAHFRDNRIIPDLDWIKLYAKFFGCSVDYLFGFLDTPTHEIETITSLSGISEKSARNLMRLKKRDDNKTYSLLDVLNNILEFDNGNEFYNILQAIRVYLNSSNIKHMVVFGDDSRPIKTKRTRKLFGKTQDIIGFTLRNNETITVNMSKSIIENSSLRQIADNLDVIKKK